VTVLCFAIPEVYAAGSVRTAKRKRWGHPYRFPAEQACFPGLADRTLRGRVLQFATLSRRRFIGRRNLRPLTITNGTPSSPAGAADSQDAPATTTSSPSTVSGWTDRRGAAGTGSDLPGRACQISSPRCARTQLDPAVLFRYFAGDCPTAIGVLPASGKPTPRTSIDRLVNRMPKACLCRAGRSNRPRKRSDES
jgi:hypothetical protein